MKIVLEESDLETVTTRKELAVLRGERVEAELGVGVSDKVQVLVRKLPAVVAEIAVASCPESFEVTSFELSFELEGKPFGVGISSRGQILYTFSST